MVVDKGRNDAGFGESQPYRHVLGPIVQKQGHCVPSSEAGLFKHMGHSVAQLVDLFHRERTIRKHGAVNHEIITGR